jgi:hypothetical protein
MSTITNNNAIFQATLADSTPVIRETTGFDVPIESVTLPSKGLAYPIGHPLNNEEVVEIKCMTAKEEDLLTSRALIKNGTVISELLKSCMLNKSINPDEMLVGDRNALLIAIRITGYGDSYTAKVTCGHCGDSYENEFSLTGLKILPLSSTPLSPNSNLFSFILPLSKKEVVFRLLTGQDEFEISQESDRKKKIHILADNAVTSRLFHSVISIGDEADKNKIRTMVSNMRAKDARALRKHIDSIEPGVEMKQATTCPHCSEVSEVTVPLGLSFFWPDLDD